MSVRFLASKYKQPLQLFNSQTSFSWRGSDFESIFESALWCGMSLLRSSRRWRCRAEAPREHTTRQRCLFWYATRGCAGGGAGRLRFAPTGASSSLSLSDSSPSSAAAAAAAARARALAFASFACASFVAASSVRIAAISRSSSSSSGASSCDASLAARAAWAAAALRSFRAFFLLIAIFFAFALSFLSTRRRGVSIPRELWAGRALGLPLARWRGFSLARWRGEAVNTARLAQRRRRKGAAPLHASFYRRFAIALRRVELSPAFLR